MGRPLDGKLDRSGTDCRGAVDAVLIAAARIDAVPIDQLPFAARFVGELPGDPRQDNRIRQVTGACYSRVAPTAVARPELLVLVPEVAELLGLAPEPTPELTEVLAGNRVLPGMAPYAACYGGHQFGAWAGQLGDGRAITLAEVVGRAGKIWEIQLKGAGPTPYSRARRRAGGAAQLAARAGVQRGDAPPRDPDDARAVARAHGRGGHARSALRRPPRGRAGRGGVPRGAIVPAVRQLRAAGGARRARDAAAARAVHARAVLPAHVAGERLDIAGFFDEVARRTAWLVAEWMRVGFVHGVMNTDNMSILGLTIDYGPYGWIEPFDLDWTPNITDASGRRYRFGAQPAVAHWNLAQLARAGAARRGSAIRCARRSIGSRRSCRRTTGTRTCASWA